MERGMNVWEIPVLMAVAMLGGIKMMYGISFWKNQDISIYGIWSDRHLYAAAAMLLFLYGGIWIFSGKEMGAVRYLDLLCTYGILAVVDGKQKIVPEQILLCFFAGQMLLGVSCVALAELLYGCLTGAALLALLLIIAWYSRGKIGIGDARLLGVTAMTAGWEYTIQLLVMAMALSFFYSMFLIVFFRKDVRTEFPFVPFLTAAMAIQMLFFL